jgi:hypothetical protein
MFVSGNQQVKAVGAFKGIVDVVDDLHAPETVVGFSVGGYYGVHADFTRIGGKKLFTSASTNGGAIISIHQLAFSDRSVIVHHSSSGYYVSNASELALFRVLNTSTSVLGPIIPPP